MRLFIRTVPAASMLNIIYAASVQQVLLVGKLLHTYILTSFSLNLFFFGKLYQLIYVSMCILLFKNFIFYFVLCETVKT